MQAELTPLIIGALVFLSSLISLRVGLSVAIIEILFGTVAGSLGLETEDWMLYLANFGGILLTFLAGTEIDTRLLKSKFKESFLIGTFSFLCPFVGAFFCARLVGWSFKASLIAGTALSTTSLAVVYSVLVEMGLSRTALGKLLMAATFVTDMGTALALSLLFMPFNLNAAGFAGVSIVLVWLAYRFSYLVFENRLLKNKVIEPEIKYVFLLLLALLFLAKWGSGHAVLPVFLLGLFMSRHYGANPETEMARNRLRTVAYALVTPVFFIVGGMKISLPVIAASFGLFLLFFAVKIIAKFMGVYFLARKYVPSGSLYTTLLMSTGLTFGTISSVFGLNAGLIDSFQYSILVGVVVGSAVIPTFVAQRWFAPVHSEDVVEEVKPFS